MDVKNGAVIAIKQYARVNICLDFIGVNPSIGYMGFFFSLN